MTNFKQYKNEKYVNKIKLSTQMKLMAAEVKYHLRQINKLRDEIKAIEQNLYGSVTILMKYRIKCFMSKIKTDLQTSVRSIHKRKLENLGIFIGSNRDNPKAIRNLTALHLTEEEVDLFSKGLDFGVFPKFLNYVDIQSELENLYEEVLDYLPNTSYKIRFKTLLLSCYSDITGTFNFLRNTKLSEKEHLIIDKFNKMDNIMILTADKGKTVVFMSRSDYINKMKVILDDNSKFKVVTENNTG